MSDEQGKSIGWVVAAAVVLVVVFGWGFLAGSYTGSHTPSLSELSEADMSEEDTSNSRRRSYRQAQSSAIIEFVKNGIVQLPNMPAVISWHFTNRIWLPIVLALALLGVIGGGFAMKAVEKNLDRPRYGGR